MAATDPIDAALQRHQRLVQALGRISAADDGPVEVVQTHLSTLLLSRDWALKL